MFWGIEASLFIPCIVLIGATMTMFAYHLILYFQYRERILWKYCFYLGAISIYLFLDLLTRSDGLSPRFFQADTLSSAINFIVILGYASFLMEAVISFRPEYPRLFMLWSVVYYSTIIYIIILLVITYLDTDGMKLVTDVLSNTLRVLFVPIGVIAIVQFYPLVKGRFMNLVKWGGMVYLFFMLLVLIAMFQPGKELFGLNSMHFTYLGTFADVLIFSYAMSIKIKDSLNKAAQVRQNLSRDLHDEVGATLTGIRVFSQLAKERPETQAVNLEKINLYSEEMLNKMSDIVWALNPDNDNMEKMIGKLKTYAISVTSARDIELEFTVADGKLSKNMDMNMRKNIFLLAKEAINNAVKYSGCKKLKLLLTIDAKNGNLRIEDDGIGFNYHSELEGNGLKNMRSRALEANGKLDIQTGPGKGTLIELNFSFT